jgi:flagellar basal-body rod protein FlgB
MDIASMPFFATLKSRLGLMGERQRVLAENVANATTPRFTPRDVDLKAFARAVERSNPPPGKLAMARTDAGHAGGARTPPPGVKVIARPDSETTLDGNQVVLEEQMIRVAETRMQYDAAIGLYQKGLQLVRLSARAPGR